MKCNKCGSENAADSKFCYNCGAPLEADVQSVAQADPYTPVQPITSAKPQKQKKIKAHGEKSGKKGVLIALVAVIAVLLIGGLTVFAALPQIERSSMGEAEYYLYKEYKNVKNIFDVDFLSDLRHPQSYSANSQIKLTGDCGDYEEYSSFLEEIIDSVNANAKVDYDKDKKTVSVNSNVKNKEDNIFTINAGYSDHRVVVGSDLEDNSTVLDFRPFYGESTGAENETAQKASETKKTEKSGDKSSGADLVTDLKTVCDEQINDECIKSKGKEKHNGKSCSYVEFEFTDKQIDKIAVELLKAVAANEGDWTDLVNTLNEYYQDIFAEYVVIDDNKDFIQQLISEITEDGLASGEFDKITFKVYYDFRGNIVSRQLAAYDMNDEIFNISVDSDFGRSGDSINILAKSGDNQTVTVSYLKSMNGGKMNCNIDCLSNTLIETVDENVENILSLNIKLSDIGVETVNGISVLGGNLSFSYAYDSDYKIDFEGSAEAGENYDIALKLKLSGDDMDNMIFKADLATELSANPDVSGFAITGKEDSNYGDYFERMVNDIADKFDEDLMNPIYQKYYSQYLYSGNQDYYDDSADSYDDYYYDDEYDDYYTYDDAEYSYVYDEDYYL